MIRILVPFLLLAAMPAWSDRPDLPPEEEFVSLFDGESLDGWMIQGMENAGPRVRDGGIMDVSGWDYWAVITEDTFRDFALRFEFRISPRGNSGILIHTLKDEVFKHALEIQIADDQDKSNEKDTEKTGAIFGHIAPLETLNPKPGQWYEMEIICFNNQLRISVGETVLQDGVDLAELEAETRTTEEGAIAIQRNDLRKGVFYRNLRIFPYNPTGTSPPETLKDGAAG